MVTGMVAGIQGCIWQLVVGMVSGMVSGMVAGIWQLVDGMVAQIGQLDTDWKLLDGVAGMVAS